MTPLPSSVTSSEPSGATVASTREPCVAKRMDAAGRSLGKAERRNVVYIAAIGPECFDFMVVDGATAPSTSFRAEHCCISTLS